ncbi:hypothetical protein F4677DRAFT_390253 [Hypoxylon crocopeplum]|nr:hypothetical protein F4677DRAFT_390253 [Hypoxylon crocopeplum]
MAPVLKAPVTVQYVPSVVYSSAQPETEDPFRHLAGANSHNHHALHPWGNDIVAGTNEFDFLYAEANNKYMYHLWYSDRLAPYMATEVLKIEPLASNIISLLESVLKTLLELGIDAAMESNDGKAVVVSFQAILDDATKGSTEPIFVRLGATSAKDSFAKGAPTTKPSPLPADANIVLRRFLTSGRVVGRLLALVEGVWPQDPGEALIVQRWSPNIELQREIRVFCYGGKVTAISQDIWWEKAGWRNRYSDGFVQAITDLWGHIKDFLLFESCTMDVLMTPPLDDQAWQAKVIEFNGFGAHLNTGSDLFHWVKDADILQGKVAGVTVRFVDDWEDNSYVQEMVVPPTPSESESVSMYEDEPDWLILEKQLQAKYADKEKDIKRIEMEEKAKLPLRGRWCSAY